MQNRQKFLECLNGAVKHYHNDEKFLKDLKEFFIEYSKSEIDPTFFQNQFQPLFSALRTYPLKDEKQRASILKTTLQEFNLQGLDEKIVFNHLLKLSQYDAVYQEDDKESFFLLSLLLLHYQLHLQALQKYDVEKLISQGVAYSTSKTPQKIIQSKLNALKTTLETMPNNKELIIRKNIYETFKSDNYGVNFALATTLNVGKIRTLSTEENQYLIDSIQVINSSKPLEKKDFFKSANTLIANLFNKSFLRELCNIKKSPLKATLIEINSVLMEYIFNTSNILNNNNLKQSLQIKSYFYKIPIFEFQNKKNAIKHPMFEDTQENEAFWQDVLENFKGKFPLK